MKGLSIIHTVCLSIILQILSSTVIYAMGADEQYIDDWKEALKIQPNYTNCLLRCATSYCKVTILTFLHLSCTSLLGQKKSWCFARLLLFSLDWKMGGLSKRYEVLTSQWISNGRIFSYIIPSICFPYFVIFSIHIICIN